MLCPTVDLTRHVRLWVGPNRIPERHFARWLRLLCLDHGATLTVLVDSPSLAASERAPAAEQRAQFSALFDKGVVGFVELRQLLVAEDDDEAVLVQHIIDELDASVDARVNGDTTIAGNMSVVADQARLLRCVQRLGAFADCDVLFMEALPTFPVATPSGIVARYKAHGTLLSNDFLSASDHVIEGRDPSVNFLCHARRRVADMIRAYRVAAAKHGGPIMSLRNKGGPTASARFSFCGGPHAFAISAFEHGIETGYEETIYAPSRVAEEPVNDDPLDSNDAKRQADDDAGGRLLTQMVFDEGAKVLRYHVFQRPPPDADSNAASSPAFRWKKADVFAKCIDGVVFAAWDHSWTDEGAWKRLNAAEEVRLRIAPLVFQSVGVRDFRRSLLAVENYFLQHPSRNTLSLSSVLLESLLRPIINGPRRLPFHELPADTQSYIQDCETPSDEHREAVRARVTGPADAPSFLAATSTLQERGVVVLHEALTSSVLAAYQRAFEAEVAKKKMHEDLKQVSFNCAVDEDAGDDFLACSLSIAQSPQIRDLIEHYIGHPIKLTGLRGYRTEPISPVAYRAWDYHQDLKSRGPYGEVKVMVLLTNVPDHGQAMRYSEGSAQSHWVVRSMRDTKYTYDEARAFGTSSSNISLCSGAAGSLIIFDTNGIHSGHRNLSCRRDVVTLSFAADLPHHRVMFSERMCRVMATLAAPSQSSETVKSWSSIRVAPATPGSAELLASEYEKAVTNSVQKACDASWDVEATPTEAAWLMTLLKRDLHGDLDLTMGVSPSDDKARDNYLVYLRDCDAVHPRFELLQRTAATEVQVADAGVQTLQRDLVEAAEEPGSFDGSDVFRRQLADALQRVDSIGRLRTLLAFSLCTLADVVVPPNSNNSSTPLPSLAALQRTLTLYRRVLSCCHSLAPC